MATAPDFLAGLNPAQRDAVEAPDGPVLVLAGPGSGKTRVLTHRVAYLLEIAGVPPWRVMAVTFTNKAAREMTGRLEALVGHAARSDIAIGTFHAICARLLRREARHADLDPSFVIFDTSDQERAVKRAIEQLRLDEKAFRPNTLLAAISAAKNELVRPAAWQSRSYFDEVAGRVYERYQAVLRASNALDFDDLLLETAFLLRDQPVVRDRYRERYAHVLVDEFQDTNTAQYALVKALAAADLPSAAHNVFVVGDEDQSIYRWRGADYRNIQRFRADFPNARVVLLEQNYRSTQTILDAARAVIDRNRARTPKALWTEAGQGSAITVFEAHDEAEEAAYVVSEIAAAARRGEPYGHFAVMYRTNAQSRAIEDALVLRRLPYQLVGATRFYERREVKDVLAYLRLVHNPLDALALERIVNVPPRGIGAGTWRSLTAWSEAAGLPAWAAVGAVAADRAAGGPGRVPIEGRGRNALAAFHELLAEWIAAGSALSVPDLLTRVIDDTGYERWLRDGGDEGEDRWANVQELRGVAEDFADHPPGDGLTALLEAVALVSDVDSLAENPERVTLLTLHAAKGLEFDTVFIAGLEENNLPHIRSQDDPDAIAEERRLFYVGLTRARRKLYLTHAFRRTVFGSSDLRDPSRFLADVPASLLADRRAGAPAARPPARQARYAWQASSPPRPGPAAGPGGTAPFRPGDKVRHGHFGPGVVVASVLRDGDEEVTVAFEGVGVKKLLRSLAHLTKRA